MPNLFDTLPPNEGRECMETLHRQENVMIERIGSNRAVSVWYDQPHDEWVVLVQGSAKIEFENETKQLQRGDYLFLPAHCRHRVVHTSENALWLAVRMGRIHESMIG